jgi:hypothetical protein
MEKEEILAKSRKENKNVDIVEMTVINHAFKTAATVAVVECIIISGIDDLFSGTVNSAYWTVAWSIFSTVYIYKYIKLRRKHDLYIAIFYSCMTILSFVTYMMPLLRAR